MADLVKTRVVHSRSEIQIRGQTQKESNMGGIIIMYYADARAFNWSFQCIDATLIP